MSKTTDTPKGSYWYNLFAHIHDEHGLVLTDGELADIANVVATIIKEIGPWEAVQLKRRNELLERQLAEYKHLLKTSQRGRAHDMAEAGKDSERLDKLLGIITDMVHSPDFYGPWPPTTRQAIDQWRGEKGPS